VATDLVEEAQARRDFKLPAEDVESLDALRLPWDTIAENATKWLIIRGRLLPSGYNHGAADVALRIPPSYPDDQIDMAYFSPALSLASGKPIRQITSIAIEGKTYQQWSRHRTSANPWRPGLDDIGSHLLQVDDWLRREVTRP